jgi:TonB family protein
VIACGSDKGISGTAVRQHIIRLLLAGFCLTSIRALALEADTQVAMSQACGLAAGRQQVYVIEEMQGAAPSDSAGIARYRELLRYSSSSARDAMRIARPSEPALVALDNWAFDDAVNLGIVLQSDPAITAQAITQATRQGLVESSSASQQLAALREAWTGLCLQQLKSGLTLSRRRELSLCNTFAVVGVMQRWRSEQTNKRKVSPQQIELMLRAAPEVKPIIDETLALSWVDDQMKSAAFLRASIISAEAPAGDVSGYRELAQQLATDPLRLPYGDLCKEMASGARSVPASDFARAPAEGRATYEVIVRPSPANFYPPESARDKEQGNVTIEICFDATGKVTESIVKESSRSRALDKAAIRFGMAYQFKPGMVNFAPKGECVQQQVRFSLQ